ncbi:MAG: CcmD family protein [Raineya sp.]
MKKLVILLLLAFLGAFPAVAQNQIENFFRTDEKFYVVVAVLAMIMFGILFYVVRLDRKISNLEEKDKETSK